MIVHATLNLTINNSSIDTSTVVECDSYTWNGNNYTSSGTYTWVGTNSNGCDSTVTLNLVLNNSTISDTFVISFATVFHGMGILMTHLGYTRTIL